MARILVIDDDKAMTALLRGILEAQMGHQVTEAYTSEDGLSAFRQDPFDLVITDIFMPERGGIEVIKELRADFPEAKIIAISGVGVRDELDIVSLTTNAGANLAFEKPFEAQVMMDAVTGLLDERAS